MTQGTILKDPSGFRAVNPSFRPIRYFPTWATSNMLDVESSPFRTDALSFRSSILAAELDARATSVNVTLRGTRRQGLGVVASTAGPGQNMSTSCSDFVTWVRIDDELMRVDAIDSSAAPDFVLQVQRGFSGTHSAAHALGSPVLAPVYSSEMPPLGPDCAVSGGIRPLVYQLNPTGLGLLGPRGIAEAAVTAVQALNYSGIWLDCFAASSFQAMDAEGAQLFVEPVPATDESIWDASSSPPRPFSMPGYHEAETQRLARAQAIVRPVLGEAGSDYFLYANNLQATHIPLSHGADFRHLETGQVVPAWPGNSTPVSREPLSGYCNEAYALTETGDCHLAFVHIQPRSVLLDNAVMVSNLSAAGLRTMPMAAQAGCKSPALERLADADRDRFEQYAYAGYLLAVAASTADGETSSFGIPALYWRNTTLPNGTVTTHKYARVHPRYTYGLGQPVAPKAPVTDPAQWALWAVSHPLLLGRTFSGGVVVLNPGDAPAAKGVPLNATLLDPDNGWKPVTEVDMPSGTAKLLLRSKPPATMATSWSG